MRPPGGSRLPSPEATKDLPAEGWKPAQPSESPSHAPHTERGVLENLVETALKLPTPVCKRSCKGQPRSYWKSRRCVSEAAHLHALLALKAKHKWPGHVTT